MDNQDNRPNDRWNTEPSQSNYYNQPTHKPYGQSFSMASSICGTLALITCYLPFFAIPLGSLGLLFASLVYRKPKKTVASDGTVYKKRQHMPVGFVLSLAAVIISCVLTVYALASLPQLLQDEAFIQQMDAIMNQLYGTGFQEMMQQLQSGSTGGYL